MEWKIVIWRIDIFALALLDAIKNKAETIFEKKCINDFSRSAAQPQRIPTISARNKTNVRSLIWRSLHITNVINLSLMYSFIF